MRYRSGSDIPLPILIISLILIGLGVCLYFYPVKEKVMTVRSMRWELTIQEVFSYTRRVCKEVEETVNGQKVKREKCENETVEEVTRSFPTKGEYPETPYWESEYRIRRGHTERRIESYTVVFSDDGALYNYYTGSLADYNRFTPREKRRVAVNIFGIAIRAN